MKKLWMIIFLCPLLQQCNKDLDYFNKHMNRLGYLPYTAPLSFAGTGTLIGGDPSAMQIIAHPDTCFPPSEMQTIRQYDDTSLPSTRETIMVNTDIQGKFFDFMKNTSPSIKGGVKIKDTKSFLLEFEGVRVEYLDSVRMVEYYRNHMSETCKDFLDKVGFIVQAIQVTKMKFTFFNQQDGEIWIDADNINQYVDFSLDVDWSIDRNTTLVIDTPKYIGYQLGSLR